MKIDQVLAIHLYNQKELTLQGIGTFKLDNSIALPADSERDHIIPPSAITFYYNPKAPEDPALVDSIVLNTNKIKPLASADLDSYIMLGRQFMNIGKPFILEGIGTLDKTQAGEIDFKAGQFTTQKLEAPKALKENENEEKSGLFNDYNHKPDNTNNRRNLIIIATVIFIGIITWLFYHFAFNGKSPAEKSLVQQATMVAGNDSLKKDSILVLNQGNRTFTDSDYTFRVIFDITNNKQKALSTISTLNNLSHKVIMYTTDSVTYKIAEFFNTPLADSTRAKDSLNKIYGGNVTVEVNKM